MRVLTIQRYTVGITTFNLKFVMDLQRQKEVLNHVRWSPKKPNRSLQSCVQKLSESNVWNLQFYNTD